MVTGSPAAFLLVAVVGALVLGSDGETFKVAALALRHPATQVRLRGGFSGEGASTSQLAAYMLCRMGGNDSPTLDDVKACLDSIGAKVEEDKIQKIIEDLSGKDIEGINDMITAGRKQYHELNAEYMAVTGGGLDAMGGGGQGGGDGGNQGSNQSASAGAKKEVKKEEKEEKKEEKKEASEESMSGDMGFGLFD